MSTPVENPPVKEVDPFVKSIADSFNKVITPDPDAPVAVVPPAPVLNVTLSEAVVLNNDAKKNTPAADAPVVAPITPPVKKDEPVTAPEPTRPIIQVVKREPQPPAAPPVNPPIAAAPATPTAEDARKKEEQDYINALTPEQQDEVAFARFAEANGKPGVLAQTVEFFRKVDKFAAENPEHSSKDFDEFVDANKPKWDDASRRRLERQMIKAEAVAEAKTEVLKETEQTSREVREIKMRPVIDKSIAEAGTILTAQDPENKDMIPIPADVAKRISEVGYEKAIQEFPVEAPIYQGTMNAVRAWNELATGLATLDEHNMTHDWLLKFIAREGSNMLRQPKDVQVINGRQFLPMHQYIDIRRNHPEDVDKYWTFSDEMITDMIAQNGIIQHTAQVKSLEGSGWKKQVSEKSPNPAAAPAAAANPTAPAAPAINPGPRATARAIPGASDGDQSVNPNAPFLEQLVPGAGRLIGK